MLKLHEVDLNLLVVFMETLRHRRVAAVANHLGLSQPAVSNALARLRRALGDDLFVRTPTGMAPTPFAETLATPIADALLSIQRTLNHEQGFDPLSASKRFTIAMSDVGEMHFLPRLYQELSVTAPHVTIATVRPDPRTLQAEMESGKIDLAVGLLPNLSSGFMQRRLFRHRYVCMFRTGHPLDKPRFTRQEFFAAKHAVVASDVVVEATLAQAGVQRLTPLSVPHFGAVPYIVSTSDLVVTVPGKLAECAAKPFGLRFVPHPIPLPTFQINVFWHRRFHRDPGVKWMRTLFIDNFGS